MAPARFGADGGLVWRMMERNTNERMALVFFENNLSAVRTAVEKDGGQSA